MTGVILWWKWVRVGVKRFLFHRRFDGLWDRKGCWEPDIGYRPFMFDGSCGAPCDPPIGVITDGTEPRVGFAEARR